MNPSVLLLVYLVQMEAAAIPFFHSDARDIKKELERAREDFQEEVWKSLRSMSREHSKVTHIEQALGVETNLSEHLEGKITKLAELFEEDTRVLGRLLRVFPVVNALTDGSSLPEPQEKEETREREERNFVMEEKPLMLLTSQYDSPTHVFTHIVRDYSALGTDIRKSVYGWCTEQLPKQGKILVPGAGLGRLARDIHELGYTVEANDLSIIMAAASYHLLNANVSEVIHPFLYDFFSNEIHSKDRFRPVPFHNRVNLGKNSMSYQIGDFVETYSLQHVESTFDAVVTSFFLDTAANVYEYIAVIRHVLKEGGTWINVGPLQWHRNAVLRLSADELKLVVSSMGFRVQRWAVDEEGVNYRNDGSTHTRVEMHVPLRFVVQLPKKEQKLCNIIAALRNETLRSGILGSSCENEE